VVVYGACFLCAQAPKLKALTKTATIVIIFKNLNSISPPFPASCSLLPGFARNRGHYLLMLRTSPESQSSDQYGHNHDHFKKSHLFSSFLSRLLPCSRRGNSRTQRFFLHFLQSQSRAFHSSMIICAPSSTSANNSATSVFRICTQPWLSGMPILSSCLVPWT